VSDPKGKKPIEALVEALDDVPLDEADAGNAAQRLGIDVKKWAGAIRQRVAAADESDRAARFNEARRAYADDAARYDAKKPEPKRSVEEQRATMRALMARIPRASATAAVHFHKFEEATEEELAEMIKALRHLLNEDE